MNSKFDLLTVRESLENIFSYLRKTARKNLSLVIVCLIQSESCQTPHIIRKMCQILGTKYETNQMKLLRFFDSTEFMVDDKLWRCYIKMIFQLLIERNYLKNGSQIAINVDFTTITDRFLILSASIPFFGRGIPLYFSMRNYPQKKRQINQALMERAFLRELWRLLPHENYTYVIVADRGFGNVRWMKDCLKFGFDYIVRTKENKYFQKVDEKGSKQKIKEVESATGGFPRIQLQSEEFETRLVISELDESKERWSIFTSLENRSYTEIVKLYGKRFTIEKMFQDQKSSGFQVEKLKISGYGSFKRALFCIYVAQGILMFVGDWLKKEAVEIQKKVCITRRDDISIFQISRRAIIEFTNETIQHLEHLLSIFISPSNQLIDSS